MNCVGFENWIDIESSTPFSRIGEYGGGIPIDKIEVDIATILRTLDDEAGARGVLIYMIECRGAFYCNMCYNISQILIAIERIDYSER